MFTSKKVMVVVVTVFVFILGFSFAVQAYASQAQQISDPATQYLRENYGVDSVEQLIAKYRQEIQQNLSRQLQELKSEIPDMEMSNLNIPYRFGTATELPSVEPLTSESATFSQPAIVPAPIVALQYFSISGLCLVGLMVVPAVRKRKWLKRALAVCIIGLAAFSAGYLVGTITAQTGTIAIEPASFMETASYIISGDDTDGDGVLDIIYAKNGRTGQIEFSGSDAATVIQSAVAACSNGDLIVIKDDITLNSQIVLDKEIELRVNWQKIVTVNFADYAFKITGSGVKLSARLELAVDNAKGVLIQNASVCEVNLQVQGLGNGHGNIGVKIDNEDGSGAYWNVVRLWYPSSKMDTGIIIGDSNHYTANANHIWIEYLSNCGIGVDVAYGHANSVYAMDLSGHDVGVLLRSGNTGLKLWHLYGEYSAGQYAFKAEADTTFWALVHQSGGEYPSIDPTAEGFLNDFSNLRLFGTRKLDAPMSILMMYDSAGQTVTDPGTDYVTAFPSAITKIPFDKFKPKKIRIIAYAGGNETGSGKGIALWDGTAGAIICEVTWDGSGNGLRVGDWTDVDISTERSVWLKVKGSSATEDITVYRVEVQFY
ncbi:hypothetical protein DRO69_06060 [Candidatus Bathyarchaeota archaeon]|nr:MAG: hypothetical protein DRO69_06060 [Candidatus Bathyarchaeota archaeon]